MTRSKALRFGMIAGLILAAAAVLWFFVFPWIDKTYVNRPGIGG